MTGWRKRQIVNIAESVPMSEHSMVQNQLDRALEIAGALAARVKPSEDSEDWCAALDNLLVEVKTHCRNLESEENSYACKV